MERDNRKDVDRMLGDPRKAVIHMALPLMVAFLVTTTQHFVDGFWCAGLGSDCLSAIALSSTVYMSVMMLGQGMGLGVSTAIARALGAEDRGRANLVCTHAFVISVIMAAVSTVFVFTMGRPILGFIANNGDVELAMLYMTPYAILSLPMTLSGIFTGLLRGEGAGKKSMIFSAGAAILNMFLDPLFIYGAGWGLVGAALATIMSFSVMEIVVLYWYHAGRLYLKPVFRGFRMDRDILHDISIVGLPQTVQLIVVPLLMTPENSFVVKCGGATGLMVFNYSFMFNSIAMIPAQGLYGAMVPIASAAVGQNNYSRLKEIFKFTGKVAVGVTILIMCVVVLCAPWLVLVFTNSGDMTGYHDAMAHALSILGFYIPMACAATLGSNILIVLKYAKISTAFSLNREVMFLICFYIASGISMDAIYYSCILVNTLNMLMILPTAIHFLRRTERESFGEGAEAV